SAAGLICDSSLNSGETITAENYCKQIDEMHRKFQQRPPALIRRKGPIIFHDIARSHVAESALQKLNGWDYESLLHPPYSSDLSPSDHHFSKHSGNFLREKGCTNHDDAKNAFNEIIASRTLKFYATGTSKFVPRWQKCVDSNGFYF
ncbi:hypothetical protein Angca_004256, partial [Angiostrongylus cantonensis]